MTKTAILITFIMPVVLSGCDYLDFEGMLFTDESVNDRVEQSLIFNESAIL